ncbi:MAG: 3-hydroxyacyl-CoA dehydrogenase family protein [Bacteroidota bacterium]
MKVAVITNEELKEEFFSKNTLDGANVCIVNGPQHVPADSCVVFDLLFENTRERISLLKNFLPQPVFINAVTDTLAAIGQPFIRINAWPTFLKRHIKEISALPAQEKIVQDVCKQLGWDYKLVPDITGMISARIISTIINEAYYTLNEGISTRDEIDIAMKTGTNYPYGPFEWSKKIGLQNIYDLLHQLSRENILYEVSALLTNETINQ